MGSHIISTLHDPCCFIAGSRFIFWGWHLAHFSGCTKIAPITMTIAGPSIHQMLMIFNKLLQVNEGMTQLKLHQQNKKKILSTKTLQLLNLNLSLIVPFVFFFRKRTAPLSTCSPKWGCKPRLASWTESSLENSEPWKVKVKPSTGIGICLKALENTKCHLQTHTTASALFYCWGWNGVCRTCTETWIGKISIWVYFWSFTNLQCIPSRTLTYPTWGKGKSSSNMPFLGGYVNSLEGIILEIVRPFLEDLVRTRTGSECTWTSDSLKKCCINSPISGDRRIPRGSGTFQNNISNWNHPTKTFPGDPGDWCCHNTPVNPESKVARKRKK